MITPNQGKQLFLLKQLASNTKFLEGLKNVIVYHNSGIDIKLSTTWISEESMDLCIGEDFDMKTVELLIELLTLQV